MKHILITTIAAVVVVGCGPNISIHEAARDGNIKAVKQHLATGTDVNAKNRYGWTPLYYAASEGHKEITELLIAKGADVDAGDRDNITPLHQAAFGGHKEVAELLIAKGADVNADRGETPLDWAEEEKQKETVDLIRKHGGKTGEELKAEGK